MSSPPPQKETAALDCNDCCEQRREQHGAREDGPVNKPVTRNRKHVRHSWLEHRLARAVLSWNLGLGMAAGRSVAVSSPRPVLTALVGGAILAPLFPPTRQVA